MPLDAGHVTGTHIGDAEVGLIGDWQERLEWETPFTRYELKEGEEKEEEKELTEREMEAECVESMKWAECLECELGIDIMNSPMFDDDPSLQEKDRKGEWGGTEWIQTLCKKYEDKTGDKT